MRLLHSGLWLLALLPFSASADIRYRVTPLPKERVINVDMALDVAKAMQEFRIPAWCPGFYFIQHYQDKISGISAMSEAGAKLTISRTDTRGWLVSNPTGGGLTVHYTVQGDDPGLGFFGVNVRSDKAFVNGAAALMYLPDRMSEKSTLSAILPAGWKVASPLDQQEAGPLIADGYDELIDSPLQLGAFAKKDFKVGEIPFQAIYVSADNRFQTDLDEETNRLSEISGTEIALFGSAPFKRYTYFIHLSVGDFEGGLEHRASTVLAIPNSETLAVDDLAAHEFFHAWNVKQIRPKVLGPFDYSKQDRTRNLWFAEGVTDYYSKLLTYRSGLSDEGWLFTEFAKQVDQLQASHTRDSKTADQASWECWENGGFGVGDLSYYVKGFLIGLLLDAEMRTVTHGKKSLDDVMRYLYSKYHLPEPGYEENGILDALNQVSGTNLTPLYNLLARSTEEMPYEIMKKIGLRLRPKAEGDPETIGSYVVERDPDATTQAQQLLEQYLAKP
jgi:predicted metalloprotease with PDZ domain